MSAKTKERIYLAVTILCLLMCAVLLLSVFLDRPVFGIQAVEHTPVMRTGLPDSEAPAETVPLEETMSPDGLILTETTLASGLRAALPTSFPADSVDADIKESGEVCFSMEIKRRALEDYLKNAGVTLTFRQSLAIKLLPKTFDTEICFLVACTDGNVVITPLSASVNNDKVSLKALPSGMADVLNAGLSAALKATGYTFTIIQFTEDSLILK